MKRIDSVLLMIFSEFLVNLSAGWFGAALVVPIFSVTSSFNLYILTADILAGILSLMIAYKLRRFSKEEKC
jgi:hypothetical protein